MTDQDEQTQVIAAWNKAFEQCTDYDLWGQPVEAIEGYQRLSKQLHHISTAEARTFSDEQKKIIGKIAICLDLRCKVLQNPGVVEGILLDDLKRIGQTLKNVLNQRCKDFPVDITAAQLQAHTLNHLQHAQTNEADDDRQGLRAKGTLLPRPLPISGMTVLTIRIEKIGLKDATQYIDPYLTVSVKDSSGSDLTTGQDTPVSSYKENQYVTFNVDVHIQKWIDSFPKGFAIFFEFKHYKPKKKLVSTKCWAFMEKDEIKDGPAALELYKKPADHKRRNIKLLTVKPLYLHLKLILNT